MRSFVIILIIFILFHSCTRQKDIVNPKNIFTEKELNELNDIVENFDKKILDTNSDQLTMKEAYLNFWGYPKSREVPAEDFLYSGVEELIELEVFDKIWFYYDHAKFENNFVKLNSPTIKNDRDRLSSLRINYSPTNEYFILLNLLANDNDFIKNYINIVTAAGDCPPNISANFASILDVFDYSDKNHRLFIAVHYLTEAYK